VYFIATRLLRDRGAGVSLLISPLLALMRNQVDAARKAGVRAETINTMNRDDWTEIEQRVLAGEVDLLLVSPERLNNPRFRQDVLPSIMKTVGMLIVDEAHCISDWGHDFRPDYRRIARLIDQLPPTVPVLCTTATANQRVVDDIVEQLGRDLTVLRGPLDRESLALGVVKLPSPADRLAWLAEQVPKLPGSGIIYCLTIADTERVAKWLQRKGIDALAYTGQSEAEDRIAVEDKLLSNQVKVVVATSALGMGYDKPDLGFVIHYQSPGSPIAYYQQVGRAGRGLEHASGILLTGAEDADIQDFFIATAFPKREHAEAVITLLEERGGPVKLNEILAEVNVRRTRLEAMLKILEVDGAVEREDGGAWLRSGEPWVYDEQRVETVTAVRRAEQSAMLDYAASKECLMALLRNELDDPLAEPCGRCAVCRDEPLTREVDRALVAEAVGFLRSSAMVLVPRKQWMGVVPGLPWNIPPGERLEEGRALGLYGDGGWGTVVQQARRAGEPSSDEVVAAAARLIDGWAPAPAPTWVTYIPSTTNPALVEGAARGIATALGLPLEPAVIRRKAAPPQREMANTAQQLQNVAGVFGIVDPIPEGPVLLVDDLIDSGWTMTVVGAQLRRAGVAAVLPLALAKGMGD
jgi:ATP-dependent DNA helicase RecQ